MDEFKYHKNKRTSSIDGFTARAGHNSGPNKAELSKFNHYYRPKSSRKLSAKLNPSQSVDRFGSIDGFTPARQPQIVRPGARKNPTDITLSFDKANDGYKPRRLNHAPDEKNEKIDNEVKKKRFFHRKKKENKKLAKHPRLQKSMRVGMIAGAFLLLIGGGIALRAFLTGRDIFKGGGNSVVLNNQEVDPTLLKGEGDGRVNILILGKGGSEQRDGPELTDTIILASIDPIAKEAALLSIPRDLWVTAPSGYSSKINEVYVNAKNTALNQYAWKDRNSDRAKDAAQTAGIDALKTTITESIGVPVHYYTMIDFAGFKKAINTVGGIEIDVKEPLIDSTMAWENGGRATIAKVGLQRFDGTRALMYARSRKGSARGDFARADRQREVILALKDRVLSTGTLANPIKINQLISDFGGQVTSDFSVNEILRVYDLTKDISGDKVASVGLDDYVTGQMISGLSAQVPKAGLTDFSDIKDYVRNIMRDAFLKKEDAKIMILNGTTKVGLATTKNKELKSYGYNILSVGDAPTTNYTNTILVDLRDGKNKYTKNYLEKRLGVTATGKLPDQDINTADADFVIILGSNETNSSQN